MAELSLMQVRDKVHFDIIRLAAEAKVEATKVHNALIKRPIPQVDATKIIMAVRSLYHINDPIAIEIMKEIPGEPVTQSLPTFNQVRMENNLSIMAFMQETGFSREAVLLVDEYGEGTPLVIERLLATLTKLTGKPYSRRSVGGFTFNLYPNFSKVTTK